MCLGSDQQFRLGEKADRADKNHTYSMQKAYHLTPLSLGCKMETCPQSQGLQDAPPGSSAYAPTHRTTLSRARMVYARTPSSVPAAHLSLTRVRFCYCLLCSPEFYFPGSVLRCSLLAVLSLIDSAINGATFLELRFWPLR